MWSLLRWWRLFGLLQNGTHSLSPSFVFTNMVGPVFSCSKMVPGDLILWSSPIWRHLPSSLLAAIRWCRKPSFWSLMLTCEISQNGIRSLFIHMKQDVWQAWQSGRITPKCVFTPLRCYHAFHAAKLLPWGFLCCSQEPSWLIITGYLYETGDLSVNASYWLLYMQYVHFILPIVPL